MTIDVSRRRGLVLIRSGASSLHGSFTTAERDFDFALSSFVDQPPDADGALFVHRVAGPKWAGLLATIRAHWDLVSRYDYVWLPDDDLRTTAQAVNRLFERSRQFGLDLAQPALTRDSYFSHLITFEHAPFLLRFTNFIELMAPLVSLTQLERMLPTLEGALSGWGLDFVWPRLTSLGRVAILDDALITHTRPVGGPSYAHSQAAGLSPVEELHLNAARYGIDSFVQLNLGAIARNGDRLWLTGGTAGAKGLLDVLIEFAGSLPAPESEIARYRDRHVAFARNEPLGEVPSRAFIGPALELHLARLQARTQERDPA
jgi:hypothetical protein